MLRGKVGRGLRVRDNGDDNSKDGPAIGVRCMEYDNILEIKDLRLSFGGLLALEGIELQVRDNEILAVIGPNGAGRPASLIALTGSIGHSVERLFLRTKQSIL